MTDVEVEHEVRDAFGRLVVRRHADVVAAARDPELFSNATSAHLQVPNGLDGAAHVSARRRLDPFFRADELAPLAPRLEELADALVRPLAASGRTVDAVELGARYAVRAQSLWLGWPASLEDELLDWVGRNRAATRSGDRARTARVAADFDRIVRDLLEARRTGILDGDPHPDVTTRLMEQRDENGRAWTDDELVSILRNWTGGDLSSLALCVGVVVHWLAAHPEHQPHLAGAPDAALDAALDEILRIDDPFVSNRRVATRDTTVSGCPVAAGDQVVLEWRAANRDPEVVGDPDAYDPEGNAEHNLVWGTGPHVCPGRPLATLELRVLVRRLLVAGALALDPDMPAEREVAPVAGFRSVPVRLTPLAR